GLAPLLRREKQPLRRYRFVRGSPELEGLEPLDARLVVILDQRQALADRLLGQMVEADGGARRVVEQRFEALVEQRQPVLHARIALAGADGLIQLILRGRRAEQ